MTKLWVFESGSDGHGLFATTDRRPQTPTETSGPDLPAPGKPTGPVGAAPQALVLPVQHEPQATGRGLRTAGPEPVRPGATGRRTGKDPATVEPTGNPTGGRPAPAAGGTGRAEPLALRTDLADLQLQRGRADPTIGATGSHGLYRTAAAQPGAPAGVDGFRLARGRAHPGLFRAAGAAGVLSVLLRSTWGTAPGDHRHAQPRQQCRGAAEDGTPGPGVPGPARRGCPAAPGRPLRHQPGPGHAPLGAGGLRPVAPPGGGQALLAFAAPRQGLEHCPPGGSCSAGLSKDVGWTGRRYARRAVQRQSRALGCGLHPHWTLYGVLPTVFTKALS